MHLNLIARIENQNDVGIARSKCILGLADEEARIRTASQCPSEIENSDVNSKGSGAFACREHKLNSCAAE